MKLNELSPLPSKCELFRRSHAKYVSPNAGCYVLTNFEKKILYIGLTKNLRQRINEHLESPKKTGPTDLGRATYFFWLESLELEKLERTWMNIHLSLEGKLPILNSKYSPVSIG